MLFLKKIPILFLLLCLLLVTFLVYIPGLYGSFILDDYANLISNRQVHVTDLSWNSLQTAWGSGVASALARPISMLTFAANYYFIELNPYYFKLTNVLIHLATTVAIFFLARRLLYLGTAAQAGDKRHLQFVALLVTAIWALHPLNVSTVLYVVQRMTQLAALMSVLTLLVYCRFREDPGPGTTKVVLNVLVLAVLLVIGILCKENAALVVLFTLAIELFLLRFAAASAGQRLFLKLYYTLMLVLPGIGVFVLLFIDPTQILADYGTRTFTLGERLLTETRVIWEYVRWLLLPDSRDLILFHDGFVVSRGLFSPPTTLFAILALAAVVVFVWKLRNKFPLLCFGIAFFLAGHMMESTVVALELVFEHRNYLPGFGLLFGIIYTLLNLPGQLLQPRIFQAFLALFLVFLAHGTWYEATKWADSHEQLLSGLRRDPNSHRINYSLGYLYLGVAAFMPRDQQLETLRRSSEYFRRGATLDPLATRAHVGYILATSQLGSAIDSSIGNELAFRLQHQRLTQGTIQEVSMLTECWYGRFCRFDRAELFRYYQAIADNNVSAPFMAQGILDQVGSAVANVYRNPADGLAILQLVQRADLATTTDLRVIQLQMALGDEAQARRELLLTRAKPNADTYSANLDELAATLDAQRSSPPSDAR